MSCLTDLETALGLQPFDMNVFRDEFTLNTFIPQKSLNNTQPSSNATQINKVVKKDKPIKENKYIKEDSDLTNTFIKKNLPKGGILDAIVKNSHLSYTRGCSLYLKILEVLKKTDSQELTNGLHKVINKLTNGQCDQEYINLLEQKLLTLLEDK